MASLILTMAPSNVMDSFKVYEFVQHHTAHFDESHGLDHALAVVENCLKIMENDDDIIEKAQIYPNLRILIVYGAYLHDVRDHKYGDKCVSEEIFNDFVKEVLPSDYENLLRIIQYVSFSKESKGLTPTLAEPYQTALTVIRDADRIEAIGYSGVRRCLTYTKEKGGSTEDAIDHIQDKLIKLLPMDYIKTKYGKRMALPRHREMVRFLSYHKRAVPTVVLL